MPCDKVTEGYNPDEGRVLRSIFAEGRRAQLVKADADLRRERESVKCWESIAAGRRERRDALLSQALGDMTVAAYLGTEALGPIRRRIAALGIEPPAPDADDDRFFLWSRKWTKPEEVAVTWWRPDNNGYVWDLSGAGKYTREDIAKDADYYGGDHVQPIPCNDALRLAVVGRLVLNTRENRAALRQLAVKTKPETAHTK